MYWGDLATHSWRQETEILNIVWLRGSKDDLLKDKKIIGDSYVADDNEDLTSEDILISHSNNIKSTYMFQNELFK